MKKALIASTALIATAGFAAAQGVEISGYGRTGVQYLENRTNAGGDPIKDSLIVSRLRMNLNASTETDSGVEFGARFRMQWDQGHSARGNGGELNGGRIWVTSNGLTVSVGNIGTAFDSAGLLYATDLGAFDTAAGNKTAGFFAYTTGPYSGPMLNYNGVAVEYAVDALTVRASYADPDQTDAPFGGPPNDQEEFGISADYTWNDRLELSAAAVNDGNGIADNDQYFLGARYAVNDSARIGISYYDSQDWAAGNTVLLFGDYTLTDGKTNIEAYIGNNDQVGNVTDTSYGVGVNYDLGGARLGASLQRGYNENTYADMGVRFDF